MLDDMNVLAAEAAAAFPGVTCAHAFCFEVELDPIRR